MKQYRVTFSVRSRFSVDVGAADAAADESLAWSVIEEGDPDEQDVVAQDVVGVEELVGTNRPLSNEKDQDDGRTGHVVPADRA